MNTFLIVVESTDSGLAAKMRAFGGVSPMKGAWVVPWNSSAVNLLRRLDLVATMHALVTEIAGDWSYQ